MLYVIEKSGQIQHNLVNSYSLGWSSTSCQMVSLKEWGLIMVATAWWVCVGNTVTHFISLRETRPLERCGVDTLRLNMSWAGSKPQCMCGEPKDMLNVCWMLNATVTRARGIGWSRLPDVTLNPSASNRAVYPEVSPTHFYLNSTRHLPLQIHQHICPSTGSAQWHTQLPWTFFPIQLGHQVSLADHAKYALPAASVSKPEESLAPWNHSLVDNTAWTHAPQRSDSQVQCTRTHVILTSTDSRPC